MMLSASSPIVMFLVRTGSESTSMLITFGECDFPLFSLMIGR